MNTTEQMDLDPEISKLVETPKKSFPLKEITDERFDHYIEVATGQLPKFTQIAGKLLIKLMPTPKKSGYMTALLLVTDQELYYLGFKMGTPDKY